MNSEFLTGPSFDPRIGKQVRASRALSKAVMALGGDRGQLVVHSEESWASVTFTGARHTFDIQFVGGESVEAGDRLISALPEHEFTIDGQLVADAAVKRVDRKPEDLRGPATLNVTCEILMLEED